MDDREVYDYVAICGPVHLHQIMGHFNRKEITEYKDALNEAVREGDFVTVGKLSVEIGSYTRYDREISEIVERLIDQKLLQWDGYSMVST